MKKRSLLSILTTLSFFFFWSADVMASSGESSMGIGGWVLIGLVVFVVGLFSDTEKKDDTDDECTRYNNLPRWDGDN